MLLEDQKSHEEACIKKYSEYARRASNPQLKQLFTTHSQHEQQHLNTINQLLQGQIPQQNQQSQSQQGGPQPGSGTIPQGLEMGMGKGLQSQEQQLQEQHGFFSMENNMYQDTQEARNSQGQSQPYNQTDYHLCNDLLMTEKYVSGTYNTAIFEFRDTNIRQVLNHIQKEEQQHGEDIFNYMLNQGMYQPK